jgi:ABC-type antimicrobial peptide transport system permease subunit
MTCKANTLTALILFLLIGSGTAFSQFPPFQFLQKPGPNPVGLKVVNQYDPSRKFPGTPDRPEAAARQGSRPLQTLIWYPALQSRSKPMTVGDYAVLADTEINFDTPDQEDNEWRKRLKSSFGTSLWAVRDAKPVEHRISATVFLHSHPADFPAGVRIDISIRTSRAVNEAIAGVRRKAAAIDPAITIFDAEPMTEYIAASLLGAKIAANLISLLAAVGLLLAAMGLYGVLAYSVAQRTREFGVRLAMGAKPHDILALVIQQSGKLTLAGTGVGLLLRAIAMRFVRHQTFGVSPLDPITFAGVALLLLAVAFAASYLPARRAAKVDPMVALRYE